MSSNEWVLKMQNATNAKERAEVVEEYAKILGCSKSFVYKRLEADGYTSGRAKRKDTDKSNIDEATLNLLAGVIKAGIRENGKKTMPLDLARKVLIENGYTVELPLCVPVAKASRLRELLKKAKIDAESLEKDSHNTRLRSLHPNHVHQCDPSVALIYFDPESKKNVKIINDSEYYKNKDFFNGADTKGKTIKRKKCLRYVLTDHYSGSICVRYYSGYGESAEYMYDFLLYAWGKKNREDYAFHGVPKLLLWDKGSANTSKAVSNALKSLGVKTITHATGASRVKGQVENANNIVETHIESLLRLEGVKTIDELNLLAEQFCVYYNTSMSIKRMGMTIKSRHALWMKITAEYLKELPEISLCRQVFTNGVQVRKVKSDLTINIFHPKAKRTLVYSVANLGIDMGDTINASAMLMCEDVYTALVWYKKGIEEYSFEIKPIEVDEAGFDKNAAVIGEEYKQTKLTVAESETDNISTIAKELQKGETLKSHSVLDTHTNATGFIKTPVGESITIEHTHEILLSAVEVVKKVKTRIGYVPDDLVNSLKEDYPEGVPFDYVETLCLHYERGYEDKKKESNAG